MVFSFTHNFLIYTLMAMNRGISEGNFLFLISHHFTSVMMMMKILRKARSADSRGEVRVSRAGNRHTPLFGRSSYHQRHHHHHHHRHHHRYHPYHYHSSFP